MASSADVNGQPHLHQTETNGSDGLRNEHSEQYGQGSSPGDGNSLVTGGSSGDSARVREVLHSDIGLNILLDRLKQSIATARELASFLGKRSNLEEQQAHGLRRLIRATHESLRRPDHRQGSYFRQVDEVNRIHDQMAENGIQFAMSLHQMHDDLNQMAVDMDRGRKQWKQSGLQSEGRVNEAVSMMEKAKRKYYSLAEDYDRVRTGERSGGFSLRGPRSGAQYEEELQRKVQTADQEYQSRVQSAAAQRQELIQAGRPQTVAAIQELITECDSAITVQLQKFGAFNEKLLLNNAMLIAPINSSGEGGPVQGRGLREIIQAIDNTQDFNTHVLGSSQNVPRPVDIKYEQHPSQASQQATPQAPTNRMSGGYPQNQPMQQAGFGGPPLQQGSPMNQNNYNQPMQPPYQSQDGMRGPMGQSGPPPQPSYGGMPQQPQQPQQPQSMPSQPSPYGGPQQPSSQPISRPMQSSPMNQGGPPLDQRGPSMGQPIGQPAGQSMGQMIAQSVGPPSGQLMGLPTGQPGGSTSSPYQDRAHPQPGYTNMPAQRGPASNGPPRLPPTRPVFGQHLELLFQRDEVAVPMIVQQCTIAVDLFGSQLEGIYRVSGSAPHIASLKELFDHDSSRVDFRNPESFFHDVNSVAGLLKQFLRDLPDPLFTDQEYSSFINAARIDDDILRRDAIHASINALPDPNYATLRHLVLHLNKLQQYSHINRMNTNNLAICFGPTVMRSTQHQDVSEAAFAVRVVQTILDHALEIFDED